MITDRQQEAFDLYQKVGNYSEVGRVMDISPNGAKKLIKKAEKWLEMPLGVQSSLSRTGISVDLAKGGWKFEYDDDGKKVGSHRYSIPDDESAPKIEDAIRDACDYLQARSPRVEAPPAPSGDHMLVISPADVHMGKLSEALETGDEYTQEIAKRRTKEGVAALLQMASSFGLECITVNTGNDSLHIDNPRRTTTSGTPQDTDGSIFSMFSAMQRTWIWVIEQCASVAPVHVVFDPSNHPWVSDWMLNQSLVAWFRNDERVTFDVSMQTIRHRKYQVYGSNLIGYTHGDGAKAKDLPSLMQHECRPYWSGTKRGYWIVKHMHHKDEKMVGLAPYEAEKDHIGVTVIRSGDEDFSRNVSVEIVRSPSSSDGWHDRNGFVGAIKAVEAFLFHADKGQITRFTYPFY